MTVKTKTTAVVAIVTGALVLVAAGSAFGWLYGRNAVRPSAGTISVHRTAANGAPNGAIFGSLTYPQTFRVERTTSSVSGLPNTWCYGFAYGKVNKKGWVLCRQLQSTPGARSGPGRGLVPPGQGTSCPSGSGSPNGSGTCTRQ